MALSILSASFVVALVKERRSGSRHVMLVSGLKPSALWASQLVWDTMVYAVPAAGIFACLTGFDMDGMTGAHAAVLAVLLLLFGLSSLPQVCLLSACVCSQRV